MQRSVRHYNRGQTSDVTHDIAGLTPDATRRNDVASDGELDVVALQGLLDRQAIVDCLHRYARGLDRRDEELLRSVYHPDAVEDHAGGYVGGIDGLVEYVFRVHERFAGYQRYVTNTTVDIDGDEAHSESYFVSVINNGPPSDGQATTGALMLSGGRYLDRFERRDGDWRIATRVVVLEWHGSAPGGGLDPATTFARLGRDDISYDRPLVIRRR